MNARSAKRFKWTVVLGAAMLAVVFVGVVSVVTSQPAVCSACHQSQAVALARSSHKDIRCYSCHLPDGDWTAPAAKTAEFLDMYPNALLRRGLQGAGVRTSRAVCLDCHADILKVKVEKNGLRIMHEYCAQAPTKCDECHSDTAHKGAVRWQRASVMEDCVACHAKTKAPVTCDTCHTLKGERERLLTGPWQVTHGANWKQTHGMGDLGTCATCHEKHVCIDCHGTELPHPENFLLSHGAAALRPTAKCLTCHQAKNMCDSCHGLPMPHPKGFMPKHPKLARSATDPVCLKCHRGSDCSNCHVRHTHPGRASGSLHTPLPQPGGGK